MPFQRSDRPARSLAGAVSMLAVVALTAVALAGCAEDEYSRSATAGLPDLAQELAAQDWRLDPAASSISTPGDDAATVTMLFDDDTVSGQGPCNAYRGNFTVDEHTMSITDLAQTTRLCEPATMQAEADYLAALTDVRDADTTDPKRLVLTGGPDVELAYDAAT